MLWVVRFGRLTTHTSWEDRWKRQTLVASPVGPGELLLIIRLYSRWSLERFVVGRAWIFSGTGGRAQVVQTAGGEHHFIDHALPPVAKGVGTTRHLFTPAMADVALQQTFGPAVGLSARRCRW